MTARYLHPDVDGYAVVTGTKGRTVLLDVYVGGVMSHTDRATYNPRTKGPDGWALEGVKPAPQRKHKWKQAEVEPGIYGERCKCGWERRDYSSGANYQFRRPGQPWTKPERTPACEAVK